MYYNFNIYDSEKDELITANEVKFVMKHIPVNIEHRYGISFGVYDQGVSGQKEAIQTKFVDHDQMNLIIDTIFSEYPEGMYFNEFCDLTTQVTSEFFVPLFDCLF